VKLFHHAIVVLFCAVLLIANAEPTVAQNTNVSEHPMIGEAAPPFDLSTVGGDRLSLADLKGKFVVIHFGTSW
jgi:cytochrome oxidase Cu insertion factor (SCO1/SenC/PrrC family)